MAEDVAQPWLDLHCRMLSGASHGLVVLGSSGHGAARPLARWPKSETEASDLTGIAREALARGEAVVRACQTPLGSAGTGSDVAVVVSRRVAVA